jgi:hypothetical protein
MFERDVRASPAYRALCGLVWARQAAEVAIVQTAERILLADDDDRVLLVFRRH